MFVESSSYWIINFGASNHVSNSLQVFKRQSGLTEGEYGWRVGNGARVFAEAVGDLFMYFDSIILSKRTFYLCQVMVKLNISFSFISRWLYY